MKIFHTKQTADLLHLLHKLRIKSANQHFEVTFFGTGLQMANGLTINGLPLGIHHVFYSPTKIFIDGASI